MAEEREDVFQARLDKALNFLSERGFSRELRQEQRCSVKQLFSRGDLLAVLPTGFGKSLNFQVLALMKEDHVCYPRNLSTEIDFENNFYLEAAFGKAIYV